MGIRDYHIRKNPSVGNESGPDVEYTKTSGHNLELEFLHGKDEEAQVILLAEEESAGTNRFYAILAQRIEVLSKGQSVLVDKLDQSLHPLLMRAMGACSITR
jgi:AAA15 family ATPase/GTPase